MTTKMKVSNLQHQEKITCINATTAEGKVTYIILWRTPKTNALVKDIKNGDYINIHILLILEWNMRFKRIQGSLYPMLITQTLYI